MARHQLWSTRETTFVGTIDPLRPAVLEIDPGDEVELDTWSLWGGEVDATTTTAGMLALRTAHRGAGALGPHTLTGPIAVRGARPGDTLSVEILELALGPHAFNMRLPGAASSGALGATFAEGELRHYPIDPERGTVEVLPGAHLAARPFLGIMGVAPAADGPRSSSRPGPFGGNVDLRHLTAGTTFHLPVFREGAGFYAGDAHALQGDGEVNQTALETTLSEAILRFTVTPQTRLEAPIAETPEDFYLLAFAETLDEAAAAAVQRSVDFLVAQTGVPAGAAYAACSATVDLAITQMVNGARGVHARIPKALLAVDEP